MATHSRLIARIIRAVEPVMHSPRLIIAGGVAAAMAMCAVCVFILFSSRADAYHAGNDAAHNTLTLIERDITRNFELYALSLQAVVDNFDTPELRELPLGLQRALLFDRAATAKYLGSMMVLDAQGRPRIDALGGDLSHQNFADRPFFIAQRDHADTGLFISHPLNGYFHDGDELIVLSRRLAHADGSFAGVVLIAVKLQYFHDLFSGLSLGEQSMISLIQDDGTLLTHEPVRPGDIGRLILGSQNLARTLHSASGSFSAEGGIDGIERLYVFERIPNLPMVVSVGMAHTAIYRAWRERAVWIGTLIVLFGLTFVMLSVLLVRQIRFRMKAERALRRLAQTDGLTGLGNRRTLDELLRREWRQAKRSGLPLSVIFADIDRFKAYNDTYGHHAGDDALTAVAHCLSRQAQRPRDAATRYGGEEFVILLPETNAAAALGIAQRMREAVSDLDLSHRGSEFGHVTLSLGVATWHEGPFEDGSALLRGADDAVYQAKTAGRNRIVVYGSTPGPARPARTLTY